MNAQVKNENGNCHGNENEDRVGKENINNELQSFDEGSQYRPGAKHQNDSLRK
jgi:hypothetical protein